MNDLINEIEIMRCFNHPNIINLSRLYEDSDYIYLVLDLAVEDLIETLHRETRFVENFACHLAKQLLTAIADIHSKGIIHRDIKLDNILMMSDNETIVLADFGIS